MGQLGKPINLPHGLHVSVMLTDVRSLAHNSSKPELHRDEILLVTPARVQLPRTCYWHVYVYVSQTRAGALKLKINTQRCTEYKTDFEISLSSKHLERKKLDFICSLHVYLT
jgi:hypothetical protein